MINPRVGDHALGVELQIIDLVERRERAEAQHRADEVEGIQREIAALQDELARTAELLAG